MGNPPPDLSEGAYESLAVYPMLLQQTYRQSGREAGEKTLDLIDLMASQVSLYTMTCNISLEAAQMAYEAMRP